MSPPSFPLGQVFILFFIILLGWIAGKTKLLDNQAARGFSLLLLNIILPALIISSLQIPFTTDLQKIVLRVLVISFICYGLAIPFGFVWTKLLSLSGQERGAHIFACIFSNCAFMGFPFVAATLGKGNLFLASIANIPFQLLAFSIGPKILSHNWGTKNTTQPKSKWNQNYKVIINPATLAALIGLLLFFLNYRLPDFLLSGLILVGDATTPLSMILIGQIISTTSFKELFQKPSIFATSIFRIFLFPSIIFGLWFLIGITDISLSLVVTLAAMPVAANAAILAKAMNGDAKTASSLVLASTCLSLITLPILASLPLPK